MEEETIITIIKNLTDIYNQDMKERKYSSAVDTHDEITRWQRDLEELRESKKGVSKEASYQSKMDLNGTEETVTPKQLEVIQRSGFVFVEPEKLTKKQAQKIVGEILGGTFSGEKIKPMDSIMSNFASKEKFANCKRCGKAAEVAGYCKPHYQQYNRERNKLKEKLGRKEVNSK